MREPPLYFGHPAAMQDKNLLNYFIATGAADSVGDIDDPRCIIVGKKGSGKTALFRATAELNRPLRIVTTVNARSHLLPPAKHLLNHAQYANIFAYEMLLEMLRGFVRNDKARKLFTRTFNAKAFAEGNEYLKKLGELIKFEELSIETPVLGLGVSKGDTETVVRLTATPKLEKLRAKIDEMSNRGLEFLVLIDDPDLLFGDVTYLVPIVGGLLLGAVDLTSTLQRAKVCVFVKQHQWDILDWNFADFDQIRQNVSTLSWTAAELTRLISERIRFRTGKQDRGDASSWADAFESNGANECLEVQSYLFERLTNGPRDLIEFCNRARQATVDNGRSTITIGDIKAVEPAYSRECLKEVQREYSEVYREIATIVQKVFEHASLRRNSTLTRLTLTKALSERYRSSDIQDLKRDVQWLRDQTGAGLVEVLFKVGVIGFVSSVDGTRLMSYSPRGIADSIDNAESFFVHPAYHRALGIS